MVHKELPGITHEQTEEQHAMGLTLGLTRGPAGWREGTATSGCCAQGLRSSAVLESTARSECHEEHGVPC